jgi:ABC-type transport system substrate-binding protein
LQRGSTERLVDRSGTEGTRVAFEYPPYFWHAQGRLLGEYLVELLGDLGYRVSVRAVPVGQFYHPDNEFQMALDGWGQDYPAASNFISSPDRFTCDTSWALSTGLCDRQLDAAIKRAARTQASDPIEAAALWAAVDRRIVDQAPYVWLENSIEIGFVAEDVGNYQYSLQWEALLGQLWVR